MRFLKTLAWILVLYACAFQSMAQQPPSGQLRNPSTREDVEQLMAARGIPHWANNRMMARRAIQMPRDPAVVALWNSLNEDVAAGRSRQALERVGRPQNAVELAAYLDWLRWMIFSENADGRYSYLYSILLASQAAPGNSELEFTSAVLFFHGRMAMFFDGAWCEDRQSVPSMIQQMEAHPVLQALAQRFDQLAPQRRGNVLLEALTLERMREERKLDKSFCLQGFSAVARAMSAGAPTTESTRQGVPGNITDVLVDTSKVEPALASQQLVMQRREELNQRIIMQLLGLFSMQ